MMELRLHGSLGRDFGRVWNLEVSSVREAMSAICALKPGFRRAVMLLDQAGLVFKVRAGKADAKPQELGEEHLELNIPDTRVDVIPIMKGAGATGRIIAGAVLIVIGIVIDYFSEGSASAVGNYFITTGIALIIGGVAQLLTPHPKKKDFKDDIKSWTINGPLNTADQGVPLPVIYGEVLTGAIPISAGLITSRPLTYDNAAPSAAIGGDFDSVMRFMQPGNGLQVQLRFSVSQTNLQNVVGYNWVLSGMSGATSKAITSGQGTATIIVTATYNVLTPTQFTDAFSVSVTWTGKNITDGSDGTAAASQGGNVTIDTVGPH